MFGGYFGKTTQLKTKQFFMVKDKKPVGNAYGFFAKLTIQFLTNFQANYGSAKLLPIN